MIKQKKYLKNFKGRIQNLKSCTHQLFLQYGQYGLKACQSGRLTPKQLEILRKILIQNFGRQTKIWFFLYPNFPITRKPKEVRMGKGKGSLYIYIAKIYSGRFILEFTTILGNYDEFFVILRKLQKLLPIKTLIIKKNL
jgi:large subunit ribosomal protein L16